MSYDLLNFVHEQIKKKLENSQENGNAESTKALSKFATPFIPQKYLQWNPYNNLFKVSYFLMLQKIPLFFIEKYLKLSRYYDTTLYLVPSLDLEYFSYCEYMRQYTKYDAIIEVANPPTHSFIKTCFIKIQGLKESNQPYPLICYGDSVVIGSGGAAQEIVNYEAIVYNVTQDGIYVYVEDLLYNIVLLRKNSLKCFVTIIPSSLRYSSMKMALEFLGDNLKRRLCPEQILTNENKTNKKTKNKTSTGKKIEEKYNVKLIAKSEKLYLDKQQQKVLDCILNEKHGKAPCLIFGSAGSGKSTLCIIAVKQLLKDPQNRILIVAPSDSSLDVLVQKLIDSEAVTKNNFFYINSFQRDSQSLSFKTSIIPFVQMNEQMHLFDASESIIVDKQIIACNTWNCIYLHDVVKQGHFSHIFIDEAAQSLEMESLIPIRLAGDQTRIILSGDPKQLNPILFGTNQEFGIPLIQRLAASPYYREFPQACITLNENYRSQNEELKNIVRFVSESPEPTLSNSSKIYTTLPRQQQQTRSIRFIGLNGNDQVEDFVECKTLNNTSWYNWDEIEMMKNVLIELEKESQLNMFRDVGIITPFVSQLKKIRETFSGMQSGLPDFFQGQQKQVIIISTVHSTNFVKAIQRNQIRNSHEQLGILDGHRIVNVLTRAEQKLIIIGNPNALSISKKWQQVILETMQNKQYEGCDVDNLELPEFQTLL